MLDVLSLKLILFSLMIYVFKVMQFIRNKTVAKYLRNGYFGLVHEKNPIEFLETQLNYYS